MLVTAIAFLASIAAAGAEPVTQENIVGTWEGSLIDTSGRIRTALGGMEAYIVRFEIRKDLSLSYTEFHNKAKSKGILGTDEVPACPGNGRIKDRKLLLTIDCSRYSKVYTTEVHLAQKKIDHYRTRKGLPTAVVTSLFPLPVLFQLRKLED